MNKRFRAEGSGSSRSDQRGLLSTELAILMPIMLMLALLAVYVVQVERHSSRAQQAADAAARAASLTLNPVDARTAAQTAAEAVCYGTVVIAESDFAYTPPTLGSYTPGRVAVGLTCTEPFRGFAPLAGDGSRTESGVAVSAIEYWRSSP
ncbi:MAG: Flp pilus assembly protein TadG [Acidimicrobiales bacterium]|jgi:Flp pilus assembly protein TadG